MSNTLIILEKYKFQFLKVIKTNLDEKSNLISYSPQSRYNNKKNLKLNKNGDGSFCKFKLNIQKDSGVYLWEVNNNIIYIGESINLYKRFNNGYGNISPRNCFIGGQSTNCKMNKIVKYFYENNLNIKIYYLQTNDYQFIEKELIQKLKPICNINDYNKSIELIESSTFCN